MSRRLIDITDEELFGEFKKILADSERVNLSEIKPITLAAFCENTGINRRTAERWVDKKKILTDKKTGRILFTEIFKFKKHD